MSVEKKEEALGDRYPYIAIVGAPGSGKSRLKQAFTLSTGEFGRDEPFAENPHLRPFYEEDPRKHSFLCQMQFMQDDARSAMGNGETCALNMLFQDAGRQVNRMVAYVQWRNFGYMTDEQHSQLIRESKKRYEGCLEPDVYIYLRPNLERILHGIRERGRGMELSMMERNPDYFPTLARAFDFWYGTMKRTRRIIRLDVEKPLFSRGNGVNYLALAQEALVWVGYELGSEHQMNGVGTDGKRLIFPSFLR